MNAFSSQEAFMHEVAARGGCCLRFGNSEGSSSEKPIDSLAILDAERRRIAQDLHDETIGDLTGLNLMAGTLADELSREDHTAVPLALTIRDRLQRAVEELRRVIYDLAPAEVSAGGLPLALTALVRRVNGLQRVQCTFACPHPIKVNDERTANAIYRIAQEAVNNAVKHAEAQNIEIVLGGSCQQLRLEVRDDGRGLGAGPRAGGGMGLCIMRQRAEKLGGHFSFQSLPSAGSLVTFTLRQGHVS